MVSFSVKKKSRKYNKNNSIINRFLWFFIALLFLVPQFTFTAATPTGQLLKQLGSGAPLSYGDYVGSSAGLNTYYSYYIEVPASLSRLVIRIFDADVGMGGNHDWTPDSYNTSVTYTVYDPNGNTVTQNFTTGSSTGPSNSDNRWRRLCRVNSPMSGHWEVRADMSSAVTSGNDMNGYGISAADNTGTELNIYAESFLPVGQLGSPTSQTTQLYPYITSGGIVDSNDFDGDNGASTYCTLGYTTRLGATAGFNGSGASSWLNVALSGFNSDDLAVDYGIWNASLSYYNASSNFATYYMGNYNASNPPPTNQPETGTFRVYFPTNAGAAPVKPFLAQRLSHISGPNPPAVGSTTRVKVAVTIFNPTPYSITFSSTNPVTTNIPGSGAVYAGNASVTQGSVTAQPSVGGTGNITWNPGTVSGSGNSETLYYEVDITPTSSAQRIPVTGTPAANGTGGVFVDETGNTTQSRATFTLGPLSELAATEGTDIPTLAVISSFTAYEEGGQVVVQWQTESEIGTAGFYLLRRKKSGSAFSSNRKAKRSSSSGLPLHDEMSGNPYASGRGDLRARVNFRNRENSGSSYRKVNRSLLPALLHHPRGGTYRMVDEAARYGNTYTYKLVEVEADGRTRSHGPFKITVGKKEWDTAQPVSEPLHGTYDRKPHPLSAEKEARLQAKKQEQAIAGTTAGSKRKGSLKISVKETGLYYLSAAAIANTAGILSYDKIIRMIGNHNFILSNRGEEVSWLPAKENSGLYFYGEKCDSIYTDKNIYWLTPGRGRRMQFSYGGSPMPGSGNETFPESLHIEEDHYALTALFSDPEGDFWLWDFIKGDEPGKTFSFSVPGPVSYGSAYLTIELKGATDTAAAADHHAKVSLNGTYLGECRWDGIKTHRFEIPIDPALLIDGQNSVEVSGVLDSGVSHSIFYVDSIDLNYYRYYRAVNNRLLCRGDSSTVITVSGFSCNKIRVFDVTEPKRPQLVRGAYLDVENRVSFIPAAPENRYFVLDTHGLRSPAAITVDKPSNLKQKRNAADYIVIAPPGLERAAANLADLRSYSGLEAMVVELEDIYDEFNHGIIDPAAIKTFLTYAYHNWRGSGPKYAVLAGGGTYDYKDILGYGDNLIPPLMVNTPKGLFASDNRFGDAKGEDGVPEIAVGRLPVLTATELQSYIDKMSEYENSRGAWTGRALMLADNPDEGGDFTYDSDRLADLLPGYRVNKVYLPDFATIDKARKKAKQVIDSGVVLVNFIGHAGLDRLTAEGLLKSSDVSALQNGQKLPLFTTVTCVAGRFAVPGYDSLGETLVLKAGGGAAAVWAPTGASYNRLAKSLAVKFFQALFQQQEKVIGRALVKAYRSYAACGGESFILDIYNLLGDPALRIK